MSAENLAVAAARANTAFAGVVTILFALVCGFTTSLHEMWRDELQAWLIARDSTTIVELLRKIHYEGHPSLWYLLLYAVTRVTHRAEAMQALHVAIASGCVYVVARYAPFARWLRVLFCFGYFLVYEYGVIARNYSLGLLFLFAAVAAFPVRRTRPVLIGMLLALAAQTNAFALLIAAVFAGTLLVEAMFSSDPRTRSGAAATTFILVLAGAVVGVMSSLPPPDSGFAKPVVLALDRLHVERVLGTFAQGLLPIAGGRAVWGELWLETGSHHKGPLLAIVMLAGLIPYFRRRWVAGVFFAAATSILLLLFYLKLDGSLRHHGHFFIILAMAVWMGEIVAREARARQLPNAPAAGSTRTFVAVAGALLALHVVVASVSIRQDTTLVFSAARDTAALLVEKGLDRLPMVGDDDFSIPPVLGYMQQRTVYYRRGSRFGSHIVLNRARIGYEISDEQVFDAAVELGRTERSQVAVVLNRKASPSAAAAAQAEEIACRSADIVAIPESYCVYRVPAPADLANP